eukprot:SAG31_NODE_1612_length_7743_cov_6.653323_3_plen_375_part_00
MRRTKTRHTNTINNTQWVPTIRICTIDGTMRPCQVHGIDGTGARWSGPALQLPAAACCSPSALCSPARAAPYPARRKLLAPPRPRPAWGTTSSSTVRHSHHSFLCTQPLAHALTVALRAGYARGTIPRENVVVLDNGSGYIKAGFAKDHFPRVTFPSIVGRPILRTDNLESGDTPLKDLMIGDECVPVLGQLDVTYPIKEGKVEAGRWEDMDALWTHTFSKLNVDPTESLVLLTEAPQNSMQNRIQYLETMFEHHGFRGVCLVVQAVLTLYANGQLSGVVLDSGDGVTHTMPVYESTPIPADNGKGGVRSLKVAGRHVTQHLQKLLESSGYSFNLDSDMELLKDIKEKCCFVSVDPRCAWDRQTMPPTLSKKQD